MAKFAKTTEIDISAMHEVVEEQPPKRSKWFTIIPIIISLIIAFGLWIYVTENSSDVNTVNFSVVVEGTEDGKIELVASGTNRDLADFDKNKITAEKIETNNGATTETVYKINYENVKSHYITTIDGITYEVVTIPGISISIES